MPELPEVETTVRDLRGHLVGRRVLKARVTWLRTVATPPAAQFERTLPGHLITALDRRGKYLVASLEATPPGSPTQEHQDPPTLALRRYLLIHLRMTGGFRLHAPGDPRGKHVHVSFTLDDGRELRFHDPRKFGRMWLVSEPAEVVGKLGPEPLELGKEEFLRRLFKRRGRLKSLLLNQTFLAGVGNIYADESLWHARLHPQRTVESLKPEQAGRLFRAIRHVLRLAIRGGGSSIDANYRRVNGMSGRYQDDFHVVRRAGEPCGRCRATILRTVVGQRGTYFCPRCQRPPSETSRA